MIDANLQSRGTNYNSHANKTGFIVKGFLCVCIFAYAGLAKAQGVIAGTNISNTAIVSYSTGSITQEPIESSPNGNSSAGIGNGTATEFVVDRKIDLVVTGNTNANVAPGDSQAEVIFSLQNQGNAIQTFSLVSNSLLTSDNFDINSCNIQITGVTGTPVAGVTLPSTNNIKLSPDQQATVSVRCDVPFSNSGAPIINGQTATLGLLATVEQNEDGSNTTESNIDSASGVETVFVDSAGTADLVRDAMHSAIRDYIATSSSAAPELTMNKTIVSVLDPDGGDKAETGSEVTYKIQISTTGIGTLENVVITDPTPTDMTYKLNSVRLNNTNQTDISDVVDNTDFGISTVDTATINLGNFAAGSQYEILVTYIIN